MARLIGVLLLAALVLWTGEARGECAWVLWEEEWLKVIGRGPEETRGWVIHGAQQTQAECEEALNLEWQRKLDSYKEMRLGIPVRSGPGYISLTIKGTDQEVMKVFRFLCLPDTIDPRAPKGAQ